MIQEQHTNSLLLMQLCECVNDDHLSQHVLVSQHIYSIRISFQVIQKQHTNSWYSYVHVLTMIICL